MPRHAAVSLALAVLTITAVAAAEGEPALEPKGPHPRILLDDALRATWKKQAKIEGSAVARSVARCRASRTDAKHPDYQRDSYMGFDWSANLSACLIAWVVTGSDDDARSAVQFFKALLDDLEWIGDGKGGDRAVRRDTGYAIRSMPPYAALAYDWLHDHPAMTGVLKTKALERFEVWMRWYKTEGYHRRSPATNYHAGYTLAATFVSIATGGEAGAFNGELWSHLRDDVWGTDMKRALGPGGLFDGGDFPEGWQYAPLSVAEYALAYRVASAHGIQVEGVDRWLQAMFVRTLHAMTARDTIAAIGDTEEKSPNIPVHPMTMTAILIGPAPAIAKRQAAAEMVRLKLAAKEYPLYEALAEAAEIQPQPAVRENWPTSYFSTGINAFYARTSWAPDGVFLVTTCEPQTDSDHWHFDAGNVMITRGKDELLIDPSPYGSLSSLTGNAPTVVATKLPANYQPSQAAWGEATHFVWATQTRSGVVAARCDYADQYKFQDAASEIPFAQRDIVMVPWGPKLTDATTIVVDRARTGSVGQPMYLRFRSLGGFTLDKDAARTKVGDSTFTVRKMSSTGGTPEVRMLTPSECWEPPRGQCEATRIPAGEYRIAIPGPAPEAIHVLDTAGKQDLVAEPVATGVYHLRRGDQDAYIATHPVAYATPAPAAGRTAIHVVLVDDPAVPARISATRDGDKCAVQLGATGAALATPAVFTLDDKCALTEDVRTGPAAPNLEGAAGSMISIGSGRPTSGSKQRGCCDSGAGATTPAIMMLGVAIVLRRRRR